MKKILLILLLICNSSIYAQLYLEDERVKSKVAKRYHVMDLFKAYIKFTGKTAFIDDENRFNKLESYFDFKNEISLEDLHQYILTLLAQHNHILSDEHDMVSIINVRDVRYTPHEVYHSSNIPKTNDFIYVSHEFDIPISDEIVRGIRPFLSRYGRVLSFGGHQSVLLHDTGFNSIRLIKIMKSIAEKNSYEKIIALKKEKALKRKNKDKEKKKLERLQMRISNLENMLKKQKGMKNDSK